MLSESSPQPGGSLLASGQSTNPSQYHNHHTLTATRLFVAGVGAVYEPLAVPQSPHTHHNQTARRLRRGSLQTRRSTTITTHSPQPGGSSLESGQSTNLSQYHNHHTLTTTRRLVAGVGAVYKPLAVPQSPHTHHNQAVRRWSRGSLRTSRSTTITTHSPQPGGSSLESGQSTNLSQYQSLTIQVTQSPHTVKSLIKAHQNTVQICQSSSFRWPGAMSAPDHQKLLN